MNLVQGSAVALACMLMPLAHAAEAPVNPVAVQQAAIGAPGERMAAAIWHPRDMTGNGFPLVVISHGTGAGPMAHVDTAEALASAGFVVVAPMHRGDNFQDDSAVGRPHWFASRSREVSQAIDFMLREWPERDKLDPRRIGIFGFSAGATTALISAGGTPDLGRIAPHCAAQREFVCDIIPPASDEAAAPPPGWVHDRRIAAIVLAAPGLGFAFGPSGLDEVNVPVQLWVGAADRTVPYDTNAGLLRGLLRGSVDFRNVDNAVHLSFLAPCGPDSSPPLCQDNPGFDRAAFHAGFNRSIVEFFRAHLPAAPTSQ